MVNETDVNVLALKTLQEKGGIRFFETGDWLAFREGKLLDVDSDRTVLFARIKSKTAGGKILVSEVRAPEEPEIPIDIPTPFIVE